MSINSSIFTQIPGESVNAFRPYIVVEDSNDRIHLKVSQGRKALFFFLSVLIPVFLLIMIPVVFYFNDNMPVSIIAWLAGCTLIVVIVLMTNKNIHEVVITKTEVVIVTARFTQKTREEAIPLHAAECIDLDIVYGRGGGAMFRLRLHSGKRVEFVVIPLIFMTRKKLRVIAERLMQVTGLRIEGDGIRARGIID